MFSNVNAGFGTFKGLNSRSESPTPKNSPQNNRHQVDIFYFFLRVWISLIVGIFNLTIFRVTYMTNHSRSLQLCDPPWIPPFRRQLIPPWRDYKSARHALQTNNAFYSQYLLQLVYKSRWFRHFNHNHRLFEATIAKLTSLDWYFHKWRKLVTLESDLYGISLNLIILTIRNILIYIGLFSKVGGNAVGIFIHSVEIDSAAFQVRNLTLCYAHLHRLSGLSLLWTTDDSVWWINSVCMKHLYFIYYHLYFY